MEDRCGVCLGDGTSCETVYKSFDEGEGAGEFNTKLSIEQPERK